MVPSSPAEQVERFWLPPGYRLEPVLSDPIIEDPAQVAFDGNGRMFVVEVRGYFQTPEGIDLIPPIGRVSRHEDCDNDGVYEHHTVFVDKLVFPRFATPFGADCVLTMETNADEVWKDTDTNGDGVADRKELFATNFGRAGTMESQPASLFWAMDNWLYSTVNAFRLRWTPTGILKEPTGPNGAQWGVSQDNAGKVWFQHGASGRTASVRIGDCRVDVAIARAERYPSPGALPEVWPAPMEDDLARRDFTVNAIAVDLVDGTMRAAPHALEDLRDGVLRVLHDRSFLDDPTRLWRLARYRARLGFAIEDHTRELAREAMKAGALDTVSGTRIGNELRLALGEPDPVATLQAVAELGLAPWLDPDRARIERALEILPEDGDGALTVLAAAAREPLPELGLTAPEIRAARKARAPRRARSVAVRGGAGVRRCARRGDRRHRHAGGGALAADRPPPSPGDHRRRPPGGRHPAGPELGRRLRTAREALLDGHVGDDAEAQLDVALAWPA